MSADLNFSAREDSAQTGLRAEGITVGYGGRPVLSEVSLSIPVGTITALIGPNGCGKSTLLRALGKQQKVSGGEITLHGRAIRDMQSRSFAREVAFLPQSPITPEGLSVREIIAFGRYPYTGAFAALTRRDGEAIEHAAHQAGVADLLEHPATELSGGQRQRVWVAMVIAQETPILLLDEPTTYLDPAHQLGVLNLVRELNAAGRTIVMVVHDMTHTTRYADYVVAMQKGRIDAAGPTSEVMTAEVVRRIFGTECLTVMDPESGRQLLIPHSVD